MFKVVICLFMCAFTVNTSAKALSPTHYNIEEAKSRCTQKYDISQKVYSNDFKWGYSFPDMETRFNEIYNSGKRLDYHGNYNKDENSFYLYLKAAGVQPVKITENFIKSVTRQIEMAIQKDFASFAFFPDMGHAHLHFPQAHWDAHYSDLKKSLENKPAFYEKMFSDPEMKTLYHLAEQLQMLDENDKLLEDEYLQFKYWNRNFIGKNDTTDFNKIVVADSKNKFNTVRNLESHKSWSSGYAISASKNGCFPYRDKYGKTKYFDISLHDPAFDPAIPFQEDPH